MAFDLQQALTGSDIGLLGLMMMDASRAQQVRPSIAGALLQSLQGVQQWRGAEQDRAMRQQLQQAQIDETRAQAQERQAHAAEQQRKAAELQRQQQLLREAFAPTAPIQANAVSGVTGPRPAALDVVGQRKPIDYQQLMANGALTPELAKALAEAPDLGRNKIAHMVDEAGPGNQPGQQGYDAFGRKVGPWVPKAVELKLHSLGGTDVAINPWGLIPGQTFARTQSPDSAASNAVQWARLNFDKTKDARDAAAGQLVETPTGYVRVGKDNTSTIVTAPGGGAQLVGKGGNMTEDQGKATGWLVQAENAYKNMQAAGFDKNGKPTGAAYPGPLDALEHVPVLGGLANAGRSADRQAFVQATSSLSEALLRAATGAGVNRDEALQKVRELTPLFGEHESVTAQKMAAIPLYIESLKVRAGPGANKAATIVGQPAPPSAFRVLP